MDKIILTDVDGVLVDWESGFTNWFGSKGHFIQRDEPKMTYNLAKRYGITMSHLMENVREFNESAELSNLQPHRDAVEYIAKINKAGYRFIAITSMSELESSCRRRAQQLENMFGDVFDEYIFLDTGADKNEVLNEFKDSGHWWIEDKPENAQAGLDVGLQSIIMEHGFNMHSDVAPLIKNWEHFYTQYIK